MKELKEQLERLKKALVSAFEPTNEELAKSKLNEIEEKLKERQPEATEEK